MTFPEVQTPRPGPPALTAPRRPARPRPEGGLQTLTVARFLRKASASSTKSRRLQGQGHVRRVGHGPMGTPNLALPPLGPRPWPQTGACQVPVSRESN